MPTSSRDAKPKRYGASAGTKPVKPRSGAAAGPSTAATDEATPQDDAKARVDGVVAELLASEWSKDRALSLVSKKIHGKYLQLDSYGKRSRPARKEAGGAPPHKRRAVPPRSAAVPEVPQSALLSQHRAWIEYARGELAATNQRDPVAVAQQLLALDRHGSWVRVARARCPSHVSLAGIVLVETQHTLVLQGDDEKPRRVPKAGSTFVIALPASDGGQPITVFLDGERLRATSR